MQNPNKIDAEFTIYYLSEQAVTLEFGHEISEETLQQIQHFNDLLHHNPFPGFCTSVPAYTTLSVFFDPVEVIIQPDFSGRNCFDKVSSYLQKLKKTPVKEVVISADLITIPVCYNLFFGLDLEEVASLHNLTLEEVITMHSSAVYKVAMIGFVPGFAYLSGMPVLLETPRKSSPRKTVPAGSVGIAGQQTGIYPLETPGGWQIIGRTPFTLFDAQRPQPALLKSGDQVVFKPINPEEFQYLAEQNAHQHH